MENMENDWQEISAKRFADLILDIGTFLMASGAHCGRINSNIGRLAQVWGFDLNVQLTFKGMLVSVKNKNNESDAITLFKESPAHDIHLEILTKVSHLSWNAIEEQLSIDEVEKKFRDIKVTSHYNSKIIALAVGASCAGLCFFSGGDYLNMVFAFCAAFIGSLIRFKISKMKFNAMIAIVIAAFVTTMITGFGTLFNLGNNPESAMATAVLFLIPGVPLINCVIDLIEGYLSSAMNRMLFAGFILLCIAAGMTLSITLMGISNFN